LKSQWRIKVLNLSFNKAEKIAGFGHWKINVETGLYTFSDNFYFREEPMRLNPN
jgi:hypothetical protein